MIQPEPLTEQQLDEIRDAVSVVEPEVSPPLASLADPFVVELAAKLNAVAPSPAPRSTGVHLALYEARALCGSGPLAQLREERAALAAEIERLEGQRKFLLGQLARKDAASGEGDRALREFLGGEPGPGSALSELEAAARTVELDRDAAASGESRDYRRGMTRAVEVLRLLDAPAPTAAPLAASQPSEAPVEGETGERGERASAGRVGDSLPFAETEISVRGWTA